MAPNSGLSESNNIIQKWSKKKLSQHFLLSVECGLNFKRFFNKFRWHGQKFTIQNKNTKTDIFDCTSGSALTTEAKLASIGFIETIDDNFDETSGTDSEYESSNSDEWSDVALDQGNFIYFLFLFKNLFILYIKSR